MQMFYKYLCLHYYIKGLKKQGLPCLVRGSQSSLYNMHVLSFTEAMREGCIEHTLTSGNGFAVFPKKTRLLS